MRAFVATLLGAWSAATLTPLFSGPDLPRLIGLLFLVSLAVSVAARWLPATVATLAGTLSIVAVIAVVARPGADVASGGRQLLTSALPVDPTGPTLAVAGAVAGWTMLAAGILAAADRAPLIVALPPLGCLLLGLAVGASAPALPAWHAVLGVALLAALLALSAWAAQAAQAQTGQAHAAQAAHAANGAQPPRPQSWRAVAAGVAMIAVGVAAAAAIGPVAPFTGRRAPADARTLVDAPVVPRAGVSPLQQYPALRAGTLTLGLSGTVSAPVPRLRMVTLTVFDGTYWTVGADYRRAGTTLPAGPSSDAATRETVTQDVRVDVPGPLSWLPTAGRPTRVSVGQLGLDEDTGDLVVGADQPVPTAYRATSVRTEPSEDQLRVADPAPAANRGRYQLPDAVRAFADDAVRDQPRGSAQVLALYARLAKDLRFRYDTTAAAPGGHGLFQIQRLLTDHRGTSEQYASAFAVMVRHLGYDARVVMGFRPRHDGPRFTVAGTDVDAWAEVRFAGLGWVTIDASPRGNPVDGAPGTGSSPGSGDGDDPVRRAADAPPTSVQQNPDADPAPTDAAAHDGGGAPAWALVAGGLALPVLLMLAVPVVKAVRRRRRRAADDPRRATLGAWLETLDRLRDAGLPARRGRSTAEVVETVGQPVATPLSALATLTDLAAYAPEQPDPDVPRQAWAASREAVKLANGRRRVPRRMLALFDPRTLR